MRRLMSPVEYEAMVEHLKNYKKKGVGWNEYRIKLDSALLSTWAMVLKECYENGYIAPVGIGDDIKFSQILEPVRGERARRIYYMDTKHLFKQLSPEEMRHDEEKAKSQQND